MGIMTCGRLYVFHLPPPHGVQIFIVTVVAAAVMKCKELLLRLAWLSERNFVKKSPTPQITAPTHDHRSIRWSLN
jgi:hypothetical protein